MVTVRRWRIRRISYLKSKSDLQQPYELHVASQRGARIHRVNLIFRFGCIYSLKPIGTLSFFYMQNMYQILLDDSIVVDIFNHLWMLLRDAAKIIKSQSVAYCSGMILHCGTGIWTNLKPNLKPWGDYSGPPVVRVSNRHTRKQVLMSFVDWQWSKIQ
jgi:hypothetical protein